MLNKLLNLRFFWICDLDEFSDGYYHVWRNWVTGKSERVYAGWHRHALNKKETTFETIKERIKNGIC